MLTVGSLFSGFGGIDKGLEDAAMVVRWQCEVDDYATRVLEKHWPDVNRFRDVREVGAHNLERVDLIAGGPPCQPVSKAGKRLAQTDERWLWPEFARIIRDMEPRWVLLENVTGLLRRGFGDILGDLASAGYDATWTVLSAAQFGAPHQRERVFLVANRDGQRIEGLWQKPILRSPAFSWWQNVRGPADLRGRSDIPEPLVCRSGDGIPASVDGLGNAVIPCMAEWVGRCIMAAEEEAD